MGVRRARWRDENQFTYNDTGAPFFNYTELIGFGDPTYIQLEDRGNDNDDVPFTTPGNYDYDSGKIEVTGGVAKLLASALGDTDWTMTTPANYTYDGGKIEVTGGAAKLIGGAGITPYGWWHLNEASGTNAPDSGPSGYHGTTVNMEDADWVAGHLNNCLRFDGVDEYVNLGDIANFDHNDPFSLEAWVKTSYSGVQTIMSRNVNSTQIGWLFHIRANNKPAIFFANAVANYVMVENTNAINDGAWHHIVVTHDGSGTAAGINVYVDGVASNNTIVDNLAGKTTLNAADCQIGMRNDSFLPFDGDIDECVIYDSEISAGDVTARYNGGVGTETMPGGFDTTDPDIYPNTGWPFTSVLGAFVETATIPGGAGIKYQISSDDGATWKWWSGAAWVAITGGQTDSWYYTNESNGEADVNTNIGALAGSGTFKFRAFLHSDGSGTPELDNIYVAMGLSYPVGAFEIAMNTDIQPTQVAGYLTTTETVTKPANTDVKYQYSTDSGGSWNGSWLTEPELETALQGITAAGDGTDTIRIKAQLSTTDGTVTPEIDNLNIEHWLGHFTSGGYASTKYIPHASLPNGVFAETITFEVVTPTGTTATMKVRFVDHDLEADYVGGGLVIVTNGENVNSCGNMLQFQVEFTEDHPSKTPRVNWCEITFHTLIGIMQPACGLRGRRDHRVQAIQPAGRERPAGLHRRF